MQIHHNIGQKIAQFYKIQQNNTNNIIIKMSVYSKDELIIVITIKKNQYL